MPANITFGRRERSANETDMVTIRDAEESDRHFLERMFVEAVLWDPKMKRQSFDSLILVPQLRRYFIDWGRPSDVALIASVEQASGRGLVPVLHIRGARLRLRAGIDSRARHCSRFRVAWSIHRNQTARGTSQYRQCARVSGPESQRNCRKPGPAPL
jgi:hypothetical protein